MFGDQELGRRVVVGALTVVVTCAALAGAARAATVRRVPGRYATIQQAIDAAHSGDEISVAPGRYCGAVIDRPVTLDGHGQATIVGCPTGPALFGGLRVGFLLPGVAGVNPASGTRIQGFHFDGRGVTADDLDALAFGVFARFADDVQITGNRFFGTVQAITNTAGDHWVIAHNDIHGLTLFDCTAGLCAGGDGIIIQAASGDVAAPGGAGDAVNRPEGNVVFANDIDGTIPDGFDAFSMVGIFLFAADGTIVRENRIAIPDNPTSQAGGEGVLVSNTCCGDPNAVVVPGSRNTAVLFNEGRASEFVVVVEGTGGENTQGLVLFGNRGVQLVEGNLVADAGQPHRHRHARRLAGHRRLHLL
jgi:nitrous oxidase accessory protein NosD